HCARPFFNQEAGGGDRHQPAAAHRSSGRGAEYAAAGTLWGWGGGALAPGGGGGGGGGRGGGAGARAGGGGGGGGASARPEGGGLAGGGGGGGSGARGESAGPRAGESGAGAVPSRRPDCGGDRCLRRRARGARGAANEGGCGEERGRPRAVPAEAPRRGDPHG